MKKDDKDEDDDDEDNGLDENFGVKKAKKDAVATPIQVEKVDDDTLEAHGLPRGLPLYVEKTRE